MRWCWRYRASPDLQDQQGLSKGMSIFSRLLREPETESASAVAETDELNAALVAYVHTFPQRERLKTHLEQLGKPEDEEKIEAKLQIALRSTESYLYAQVDGVKWSAQFEAELFEHVLRTSPWLSTQAFRSLLGFSGWLCWREGLNAAGPDA